jgi:beta-carotene hydroxylase
MRSNDWTATDSGIKPASVPAARYARPPILPREFYEPNFAKSLGFIGYGLCFFVGFGLVARGIWSLSSLHVAVRALLMAPFLFLSGQGMQILGLVGHEGFHLSLHKNKYVSALTGLFSSSVIIGFSVTGFAASHWNHHRYTNQASDPDAKVFAKYKTFLSRLLFARLDADAKYALYGARLAMGLDLPLKVKLPFSRRATTALAILNQLVTGAYLALYVWITLKDLATGIICVVIPHLVVVHYSGLRPYAEHAGTEEGILRDTRSRVHWWFTMLYHNVNYHLEHHMYPSVPFYNLPRVHEFLKTNGHFDRAKSHVETTIWGAYEKTTGRFQYPVSTQDQSWDPLRDGSAAE